jgi:PhzF family phenazine biosynthesis protein
MTRHGFSQVDVFSTEPYRGNPVAVVHDAQDLGDAQMAAFARWTNLSETTFLLPARDPRADYRLRIFTPGGELSFAGHPTLGSAHAWLEAGGEARAADALVQECGAGLVQLRRSGEELAFAAPPLLRSGPLDDALLERLISALGLDRTQVLDHHWVDNGPGWCALLLDSAQTVLAVRPDMQRLGDGVVGLVGAHSPGADADFEVRAFVPSLGVPEDPVTGSLNAGIAQWLIGAGHAPERYIAAQGTVLQREGRVRIERVADTIWVGGATRTLVRGNVAFPRT